MRAVVIAIVASGSWRSAQPPALSEDDVSRFLLHADVIGAEPVGMGTTQPWRLTLTDGTMTHDAHFQPVDRREGIRRFDDRVERRFVDSYHYNIAAYRLAGLLGLEAMMPVTIERTWDGRTGSLMWWVDDVRFTELTRLEEGARPSDMAAWSRQMAAMNIFAELVQDTDRNQGNILYTTDWRLHMIDFTRAFRTEHALRKPDDLSRCDRRLLEWLRTLTAENVTDAVGIHLTDQEVAAVIGRRDAIVELFDDLIERRGEAVVLFE